MSADFTQFVTWEKTTRDTIDFKKAYVDMTGDILAGLALSEIIYWYLPTKDGKPNKLQVIRDNEEWIACSRDQWWERARLTARQMDRIFSILVKAKLLIKKVFRFHGVPVVHIRLDKEEFMRQWHALTTAKSEAPTSPNGKVDFTKRLNQSHQTVKSTSPDGEIDITQTGKSSTTETTAESTSEIPTEVTKQLQPQTPNDSGGENRPNIFRVYEENIGALTPIIADKLKDMIAEYGEILTTDAIKESVTAEKRSLKYVEGILRNWKRDGRSAPKASVPPAATPARKKTAAELPLFSEEYWEAYNEEQRELREAREAREEAKRNVA